MTGHGDSVCMLRCGWSRQHNLSVRRRRVKHRLHQKVRLFEGRCIPFTATIHYIACIIATLPRLSVLTANILLHSCSASTQALLHRWSGLLHLTRHQRRRAEPLPAILPPLLLRLRHQTLIKKLVPSRPPHSGPSTTTWAKTQQRNRFP